ncbi:phenylalanine--tRNA ligase subunit beta [[Mycoplasma] anseris]|uniref:Phenylalanine--tRNA ligase beta subunit n=1 Tax=[Mycoplasma] anseris TaxID=92400 RepID=A0A2Z4NDT6_9BACT|nr:phenylalanine--tRNA ligase subunit beta [[Mycoplasma] anseris]AWX69678.1 phenylalanine--tRNA ligase subunit beta [[Mycoplasma] anseris]
MIFSYKRLLSIINKPISVEEMVQAINSIGFEVEGYQKFNEVEGIKFGYVLNTYKNPNADKLTVCEIQFANNEKRIIQTTATNVRVNKYLMAFVPGSRSGKTVFAPRTMQGIVSDGMLVGLGEIGFDENIIPDEFQDQIFVFDQAIDLNNDPMEYLELNDYLIDVSILSNRADANSYLIMAKEIAAYFNHQIPALKNKKPTFESDLKVADLIQTHHFTLTETKDTNFNLEIQDQLFLWKHKIKTFNNLIDLTNLVLLYSGVPCHVYNGDDLTSKTFSTGLSNQEISILGNKNVQLENNLVVKNGKDIVSLAATIGLETKMFKTPATKAVLELASFNLKEVRRSAKQIKLETLSSNRASKEINGGEILLAYSFIASQLNDFSNLVNPPKIKRTSIILDKKYLNKYAGFNITRTKKYQETLSKLSNLGFEFKNDLVYFPNYRYDLHTMQDFVEEVFRFYGYDNFPSKQPTLIRLLMRQNKEWDYLKLFKDKGYQNIRTFTLINPENNIFNPFGFDTKINTPLSKNLEHSQIRNSMIFSLNDILIRNQKQGMNKASFFEIGMINEEMNVLGIVSNEKTFNEIKTDITSLTNKSLVFKKSSSNIFHPNVNCEIYLEDQMIGYIAKIHPSYLKDKSIYAEILLNKINDHNLQYKPYQHAPLKSRDITINLKPNESIDATINKLAQIKGIHKVSLLGVFIKEDQTRNVTLSILLEEWATKWFDKDFN